MKFRDDIKEGRNGYYVEYSPSSGKPYIATLTLTFEENFPKHEMRKAVEAEFDVWIRRYPVYLMASACDMKDNSIQLERIDFNHLFGFIDTSNGQVIKGWQLFNKDEIPDSILTDDYIDSVYQGLPFKTQEQFKQKEDCKIKKMKTGVMIIKIFICCSAIIPVAIAVGGLQYFIIELITFLYCLLTAFVSIMKVFGKWPKSKYELQQEEINREKEHHYYHCKLNPAGFARLKAENFDNEQIKRNQQEFDKLRCGDIRE